jgi:Flp pilus assembly protein TadG
MKHIKGERSERGQSLVEFAISLVILLYLLSGAVEFGIIFFQYVQLRDAAQEGALFGSTDAENTAGIESRVRASSSSPIDLTNSDPQTGVTITTTIIGAPCEGNNGGNAIEVNVSYRHKIFMPFMPALMGRSADPYVTLNATVTDTILRPACPSP